MDNEPPGPITQLLASVGRGDSSARDRLWALIYEQLRTLARQQLADESAGHRRQPTSLVHEAYFRLVGGEDIQWSSRRHFFAAAAQAMRRILIDDARKRRSLKRGAGQSPAPLLEGARMSDQDPVDVLAIDEALSRLELEDARKAQVVMLRFFGGLTVEECAEALELSPRTVRNEWRFARAWLSAELSKGDSAG